MRSKLRDVYRFAEFQLTVILALVSFSGCGRPAHSGPLIKSYTLAECIPLTQDSTFGPTTRAWDYMLQTHSAGSVHVIGKQLPGGLIAVEYADGKQEVAANAGDYVYPADVRFDPARDLLYIKADGIRIDWRETWVFEYDLQHRRQTSRLRVDPKVLPAECRPTNSN